ncbi:MAG: hypothetical protein J7576_15850, partial [Siphonobacter aquaeclarae]|nr:hypothetical protein [Siphonobacter aquaeclarae]
KPRLRDAPPHAPCPLPLAQPPGGKPLSAMHHPMPLALCPLLNHREESPVSAMYHPMPFAPCPLPHSRW